MQQQSLDTSYAIVSDGQNQTKKSTNEDLDITISQLELIDIYRTFPPTMVEYTFFLSAPVAFRRTD